jgi:hypothetical protein
MDCSRQHRVFFLAVMALLLASLCGAQNATTMTLTSPVGAESTNSSLLALPDPASFRAYDRHSDDGSIVSVEWGRSASDATSSATYIVEIASEEDMKAGKFVEAARIPAATAWKSDKAQNQYFGYSKKNRDLHYVGIEPGSIYPPDSSAVQADLEAELGIVAGVTPPEKVQVYLDKTKGERVAEAKLEMDQRPYYFRLGLTNGRETRYLEENGKPKIVSATASGNWFKFFRTNNLIFSVIFCSIVLGFIRAAKRKDLFIRKIAGLEAVEEAIGRATEMGRSVLFVHGGGGVDALPVIAALSILGRVARRAAEYDTRVRVTNGDPIVLAAGQEIVKQGYTEAGRPDAYNPDDVALISSDQFAYAGAVSGLMVRERPAAIFLVGYFAAEALFLAETGASTGAVQIAGTDAWTQIPFFITTCDYTLIGEELYAAGAYLSREPRMLGSLRGQDVGKAFLMILLVVTTLLLTVDVLCGTDWFSWIPQMLEPF